MATYLLVNILFIFFVGSILAAQKAVKLSKPVFVTVVILGLFTAIFDSLIVASGIVLYDETKILGITIGAAPIEDFFYTLLACLTVPSIWHYTERKHHARKN